MNGDLSPNAQAILLLTAPLLVGKRGRSKRLQTERRPAPRANPKPLSAAEYRDFARRLRTVRKEPADLLVDARGTLRESGTQLNYERIHRLLERGFLLAQAVERWRARALWITTRADPDYPRKLKERLGENTPPVLYGCGDPRLLNHGGLAVVGSRNVNGNLIRYAEEVGRLTAEANTVTISGGARGTDQAATRGALDAGGRAVSVLANGLDRAALNRGNRTALMNGQLALVCPYDPGVRFLVGHAMQRNKLIYALCDAALVVNSDRGHGGTWAGATEQMDKFKFVSVYVRVSGEPSGGLEGLRNRGAKAWPSPKAPEELWRILRPTTRKHTVSKRPSRSRSDQYQLSLDENWAVRERLAETEYADTEEQVSAGAAREAPPRPADPELGSTTPVSAMSSSDRLLIAVSGEMTRQELLKALDLRDLGNLRERYLKPCLATGWIEMTIPQKPRSKNQRFRLTSAGRDRLENIDA